MKNIFKSLFKPLIYSLSSATVVALLLEFTRTGKINYIIGSHAAFFSLNHCITPLVGASTNFLGIAMLLFVIRTLLNNTLSQSLLFLLTYHIPSFFGAVAFSCIKNKTLKTAYYKKSFIGILLLTCALLFIIHPVGYYAAPYTLLWLIPLALLCITHNSPFLHALTSTFVTHAVGSVFWVYLLNTLTAEQWIQLMPIALLERIIFAAGITICYYSMHALYRWGTHVVTQVLKTDRLHSL